MSSIRAPRNDEAKGAHALLGLLRLIGVLLLASQDLVTWQVLDRSSATIFVQARSFAALHLLHSMLVQWDFIKVLRVFSFLLCASDFSCRANKKIK